MGGMSGGKNSWWKEVENGGSIHCSRKGGGGVRLPEGAS